LIETISTSSVFTDFEVVWKEKNFSCYKLLQNFTIIKTVLQIINLGTKINVKILAVCEKKHIKFSGKV